MDVEPIKIGNEVLEGRNNAHLIRSGTEAALVDTASAEPEAERTLATALEDRLGGVAAVDYVIVTHFHPDHSGPAGFVQSESDARILLHERAAERLREPTREPSTRRRADRLGVPPGVERTVPEGGSAEMVTDWTELTTVAHGNVITVGDTALDVVHTPGHTAGSIVLEYDAAAGRSAFVGDTLLPDYTPNVGTDRRIDDHLQAYISSLQRIIDDGYGTAWPGHGARLDAPERRAAEIIDHHRHRSRRVVDRLADDGPLTVWAVTTSLFDDLDGVHVHLAVSEVHAHLEHLAAAEAVQRDADGYVLVDRNPPIEEIVSAQPT
jgi:glyoxylase-like metal-dependent hydrolase (beta-lactamase superfamily II)